jgi:hypothetical protein
VDLHQVVAAALEAVDLLVGHALGQRGQLLVLAEEVSRLKRPSLAAKVCIWPSTVCAKARTSAPVVSRANRPSQSLPHTSLMTFQPAPRTQLQLVDDAAVAAHRAVQPLQVAVDHPDQVVQLLARWPA